MDETTILEGWRMIVDSTVEPVMPMLRAVGKIPSGLFVLTAGQGPQMCAMLVSFVQQLSMEPICIGAAVHKDRAIGKAIEHGGGFTLNICHAGDRALLRRFAGRSFMGDAAALKDLPSRHLPNGAVVLTEACAYVCCERPRVLDFGGDHLLYVGIAADGDVLTPDDARPMVHVRHDGSKY